MVKVRIQLPLNISRGIEEMLKGHIAANRAEYQREIDFVHHAHKCGPEGETGPQADIMIGFIPDLAQQDDEYILEHMLSAPGRFPIRKELQDSGFVDPRGCFHPFGIVPFVMFYNPDYTDAAAIPRTWNELLEPQWQGRVMMPGKQHIAPRVIRAVLKQQNPERTRAVDENITYSGMPPNVIEAVKSGEFALGVANITFGKISQSQKIKMFWPEEGFLCMPQVIAWSKGLDESLLKLGDFMLSPKVQNFLIQQTFYPAAPEAEPPEILRNNQAVLKWTGWHDFRTAMKNSES